MKVSEFLTVLYGMTQAKTLYVKGCFGADLKKPQNKLRYTINNDFNKQISRVNKINAINETTYGFDCVCMIKSALWGFCFESDKTYGGAKYCSNGVPDFGTETVHKYVDCFYDCKKSHPSVGDILWMEGHVGIYVGTYFGDKVEQVIECTPKWKDGVQFSNYANRGWKKHGKLIFLENDIFYNETPQEEKPYYVVQKKDTLTKISKKFNVSVEKLCEINDIKNKNLIFVGQKIFLK